MSAPAAAAPARVTANGISVLVMSTRPMKPLTMSVSPIAMFSCPRTPRTRVNPSAMSE